MVNKGLMRDLNQAITLDIRWLLLYWYFGGLSIPGSVRSSLRVRWPCQYRETGGKSGLSKYCRALNRQNNTPSKNPWHDQVHEPIISDLCLSDPTSPWQITCHLQQVTSYHFEYTANVSNSNFLVSSINAPERASSQHRRASTCRTSSHPRAQAVVHDYVTGTNLCQTHPRKTKRKMLTYLDHLNVKTCPN